MGYSDKVPTATGKITLEGAETLQKQQILDASRRNPTFQDVKRRMKNPNQARKQKSNQKQAPQQKRGDGRKIAAEKTQKYHRQILPCNSSAEKQYVLIRMDKSSYSKTSYLFASSNIEKTSEPTLDAIGEENSAMLPQNMNEVTYMGTEIRTFTTLKETNEYILFQASEYRALFEDYSQWLGSLLRSVEAEHKNDEWYQKSAALQKNLKGQPKKAPEPKSAAKKGNGKGKNLESSCWVQSGTIMLSSTEQGQVEILFEAIEKINAKILELEKFKVTLQQLERIGLGKNVNYIVYLEDDIPKKIVLRAKGNLAEEGFKFATELSVAANFSTFHGE
jgi:hypothetical protein